jgi:hypothetical protein
VLRDFFAERRALYRARRGGVAGEDSGDSASDETAAGDPADEPIPTGEVTEQSDLENPT